MTKIIRSLWTWYVKHGLDVMMLFLTISIAASFIGIEWVMFPGIAIATVSAIVSLKYGFRTGDKDGGS